MASNITGDPVAIAAPDTQPGPDGDPVISFPSDGDPLNVASLEQAFEAIANRLAWLRDPQAIAEAWEQRTWGVQNARGQRRWFLDHLGIPSGRIVHWTEDWRGADSQSANGSSTFARTVRPWLAEIVKASLTTAVATKDPATAAADVTTKLSKLLLLQVGPDTGDKSTAYDNPEAAFSADNSMGLEVPVWPMAAALGDSIMQMYGLSSGTAALPGVAGFTGASFYYDDTVSPNWFVSVGNGAAVTNVDTNVAVAADAWQHLRVEWWGANVADDSASTVRFYIDGVQKGGDITSNLPTTGYAGKRIGIQRTGTGGNEKVYVGPVQYGYNF